MKRIIITLITVLSVTIVWGQERAQVFSFDDRGFYNYRDSTRTFLVYEFEGRSSADLKNATISYLATLANSPAKAIKNIGDIVISLEGHKEKCGYEKLESGAIYWNHIDFALVIEFKDGKIKYNAPTISLVTRDSPIGVLRLNMSQPLPTLITGNSRSFMTNFFNELIAGINEAVSKAEDW